MVMPPSAVLVSGSPSPTSRSRALLERAAAELSARGAHVTMVDLSRFPAAALLGREHSTEVDAALHAAAGAVLVVVATPVYRATYTGLLKVFFDLMKPDTLRGVVALPIATGATPEHGLVISLGLAPLLSSVGALVAPGGIFAADNEFQDGHPGAPLETRLGRAVGDAWTLARTLHPLAS